MKTAYRQAGRTLKAGTAKPLSSLAMVAALCGASPALAVPILGAELASFTVLGGSGVTNVPTSTIVGNVGTWESGGANAVTGFNSSPGVAVADTQVTGGQVFSGDTALAQSAQDELTVARNNLASLGVGTLLSSPDLAGLTLTPGVYTVAAGITNLSGALTLDGQGNANALWVFQMASTLITSPNSVVNLINTGANSNAGVFWDVGSSATIDVNTTFLGNILALTSISMNSTATDFCGRALADVGAVTLIQNSLSGTCVGALAGSNGLSGGGEVVPAPGGGGGTTITPLPVVRALPEPPTLALVGLALVGLGWTRRRHG